MVRRRSYAVSNHEAARVAAMEASSFETREDAFLRMRVEDEGDIDVSRGIAV